MNMNIKQKLSLEKSGENIIRIYREGIFYVAYSHSALRFKRFIHPEVKLLQHALKNGDSYIRMGVVQTSSCLDKLEVKNGDGSWKTYIEVPCESVGTVLEEVVPDKVVDKSAKAKSVTDKPMKADKSLLSSEQKVLDAVRKTNTSNLTPLQALKLVDEWQQLLSE